MSAEETEQLTPRVEAAVGDWMAANGGGFITGLVCLVQYVTADGERGWSVVTPADQTSSTTLGLLRIGTLTAEQQTLNLMYGDDDD